MKKMVLVGGGGHCKSVLDAALSMDEFDEIVITDASIAVGTKIMGCKVVGSDDVLPQLRNQGFEYAFVSVGSIKTTQVRHLIVQRLLGMGFLFPVILDPSAIVSRYANIDEGTFIGKRAVINAGVSVGKHCIVNTGAILEHDCFVGDYSHVSVGAILCGGCLVEHDCFIGAGSTVIQEVNIGANVVVGAGAMVNRDLSNMSLAVGVPAKSV